MPHDALKVEDGAQPFEGVKGPPRQLLVADPHQAPPLGAEQRLDDDVAPQRLECLKGLGRRLSGPGRRDRDARRLEQRQRQVLVDGRFDGPRRIEHGNARRRDPVQGVHPEDDLLEASRRHHPHQHAVGGREVVPGRADATPTAEPGQSRFASGTV